MELSVTDSALTRRGLIRLLNTADGRVLCLAGDVDAGAVDAFRRRYGREPAPVDVVDAGSAVALCSPAVELLHEHLAAAEQARRPVAVRGAASQVRGASS